MIFPHSVFPNRISTYFISKYQELGRSIPGLRPLRSACRVFFAPYQPNGIGGLWLGPHWQACPSSHGRSGWFSQTHPVSAQKMHFMRTGPHRCLWVLSESARRSTGPLVLHHTFSPAAQHAANPARISNLAFRISNRSLWGKRPKISYFHVEPQIFQK
jgi:hypothetical protein